MTESKLPTLDSDHKHADSPESTLPDKDDPNNKKVEALKEKLRYKQAKREASRKINHKEVRLSIQANALPSKTFYIMNSLAAVIAGYGLLANSPAVVIGAMLVAMMLGPISGIALAIIDYRLLLLRTSLQTLAGGVAVVIGVGVILGLVHYDLPMTAEILGRTKPNVMDLMIALAGGAAGAFASVSPRLSVAVVGVAVATALVPPLVAGGILLAHGSWSAAFGALLLALTNMVAIQFTSSLVLWIAGFRRLSEQDQANTHVTFIKRNAISLLLLFGLGVYLTLNLLGNMSQQRYSSDVEKILIKTLQKGDTILVNNQLVKREDYMLARVVLRGERAPSPNEIGAIEQFLPSSPDGLKTRLQVRFVPVYVLQAPNTHKEQLTKDEAALLSAQSTDTLP